MAPTATRAAVSRALARSSTLRMSSWPYFTKPARSAWPGRGRVTGGRSAPDRLGRHRRLDVHRALPVLPVLVRNEQRDRPAGRQPVPQAAQRLGAIRFDGHPPAAAVAGLAPAQFGGDRVEVDREAGRHAFEDRRPAPCRATRRQSEIAAFGAHSIRKICRVRRAHRAAPRDHAGLQCRSARAIFLHRRLASRNSSATEEETRCNSWPIDLSCSMAKADAPSISQPAGRSCWSSAAPAARPTRCDGPIDAARSARCIIHSIAPLVDFGLLGEASRFEAWSCGAAWTGAAQVAASTLRSRERVSDRGRADGRARWRRTRSGRRPTAMRCCYPKRAQATRRTPDEDAANDAADSARAQLHRPPGPRRSGRDVRRAWDSRPHVASLWGPRGSGKRTAVGEIARVARLHGFVPIAARLVESRCAELWRGRSLLVIGDAEDDRSLVRFSRCRGRRCAGLMRC